MKKDTEKNVGDKAVEICEKEMKGSALKALLITGLAAVASLIMLKTKTSK